MSIWQRIFGPPPDNGDRMVRIPADVVAAVAEVTDRPGKYILDAVRQRLREDDQRVWVVYTFIDVMGLSEGSHPWRAMTSLPGEGIPSGVSVSRLWDEYGGSGHYKLSVSGYVPEEVRARFDQEVELIRSGNDRRP